MARQAGGDLQVEWLDDPTSALSGWCLPDYAPAHRLPQFAAAVAVRASIERPEFLKNSGALLRRRLPTPICAIVAVHRLGPRW